MLVPDPNSGYGMYLAISSSIGIAMIIVSAILYETLYILTGEQINREEALLLADLVFTVVWWLFMQPIVGPLYSAFISFYVAAPPLAAGVWTLFAVVSILIVLISFLMYATKYVRFSLLQRHKMSVSSRYQGLKSEYARLLDNLNSIRSRTKDLKVMIDEALRLRDIARKNPNIIITGPNSKPAIPKPVRPTVNYLIVGIGGAGTILLQNFIDYLLTQNVIKKGSKDNPYLFVFFDTNQSNIMQVKKRYEGTEAEDLIYYFNNPQAFDSGNIVAHNPWLAGTSINIIEGAGNRRAIGYAAYYAVRDSLMKDIAQRARELVNNTRVSNFLIITLNSLGGGTGSGSFIQFARDLSATLEQIGIDVSYLIGFGLLPKRAEGTIFHANAMAALKELQLTLKRERTKGGGRQLFYNPYLAYFLVSTERPSENIYDEIAQAISRFIFDLGISGYETKAGESSVGGLGYDLSDIKTRASMAPGEFFTFSRYDVYFPASRLSWLINVAVPVREEVEKAYQQLSTDADRLGRDIGKYEESVSKLRNDINELADNYRSFMPNVYKRWAEVADRDVKELTAMSNDLAESGPLSPSTLKKNYGVIGSKVASPEESFMALHDKSIVPFEESINAEESFLRSTPSSAIEYVFNVEEPIKFPAEVLLKEGSSMYSILQGEKRLDEFQRALADLRATVGSIEQTMANIDYSRVNMPLSYGKNALEFIGRYNPALLSKDKMTAKTPSIKTIVMLITSARENMVVPEFPNDQMVRDALSVKTDNPDFKKSAVPVKRFEISSYQIITGFYPYRLRRHEQPILKDLEFLEEAYNEVKRGQNMMLSHALLYNDPEAFKEVTGQPVPTAIMDAIKTIVNYWSDYDPSMNYMNVWGVLELAEAYDEISALRDELMGLIDYMNETVKSLERGSTEVDPAPLHRFVTTEKRLYGLEVVKELSEINRKYNNETISKALNDINDAIGDVFKYVSDMRNSIELWIKSLNYIKGREADKNLVFTGRVIQPLINDVTKLDKQLANIEDQLRVTLGL